VHLHYDIFPLFIKHFENITCTYFWVDNVDKAQSTLYQIHCINKVRWQTLTKVVTFGKIKKVGAKRWQITNYLSIYSFRKKKDNILYYRGFSFRIFRFASRVSSVNAVNPEIYAFFYPGKTHSPIVIFANGANHYTNWVEVLHIPTKSHDFLHFPMFNLLWKLLAISNFTRKTNYGDTEIYKWDRTGTGLFHQ